MEQPGQHFDALTIEAKAGGCHIVAATRFTPLGFTSAVGA
jgi:hypothetical protein